MNVDSDESDASLDYDVPRRKGKGKALKKKDKRKGKVTEVGITSGRSQPASPLDEYSQERHLGSLCMGGILRQVLGYSPRR